MSHTAVTTCENVPHDQWDGCSIASRPAAWSCLAAELRSWWLRLSTAEKLVQRHLAGPVAQGPWVRFFRTASGRKRKPRYHSCATCNYQLFALAVMCWKLNLSSSCAFTSGAQIPLPGTLCSGHEFKPALGSVKIGKFAPMPAAIPAIISSLVMLGFVTCTCHTLRWVSCAFLLSAASIVLSSSPQRCDGNILCPTPLMRRLLQSFWGEIQNQDQKQCAFTCSGVQMSRLPWNGFMFSWNWYSANTGQHETLNFEQPCPTSHSKFLSV